MPLPAVALALAPSILKLAPWLAEQIWGDTTGEVVKKAADIAGSVLGIENPQDPAALDSAVDLALAKADPAALMALRTKLAELAANVQLAQIEQQKAQRKAETDEFMASLADVANARNQTVELAKVKSPLAYGAAVISALVIIAFGCTVFLVFRENIPQGNREMAFYIVGQLSTFAGMVVGYWVGSTSGSMQKTQMMAGTTHPAPQAVAINAPAGKAAA